MVSDVGEVVCNQTSEENGKKRERESYGRNRLRFSDRPTDGGAWMAVPDRKR